MKRESNIASSIEIGEVRDPSVPNSFASPTDHLTKKERSI